MWDFSAKIVTAPQQFEVAFYPVCLPLLAKNTLKMWPSKRRPHSHKISLSIDQRCQQRPTCKVCLDCAGKRVLANGSGKCRNFQFPLLTFQTSTQQISDMSCRDEHVSYGTFSRSQIYCTPQPLGILFVFKRFSQ